MAVDWNTRAKYMRALQELIHECERESNSAQVGDVRDGDWFACIERAKAARAALTVGVRSVETVGGAGG